MKKLLIAVNLSAALLLTISQSAIATEPGLLAENGSERLLQQQKQRLIEPVESIQLAEDGADRLIEQRRKGAYSQAETMELAADGAERSRQLRRA
jgi:hypothetical protein